MMVSMKTCRVHSIRRSRADNKLKDLRTRHVSFCIGVGDSLLDGTLIYRELMDCILL